MTSSGSRPLLALAVSAAAALVVSLPAGATLARAASFDEKVEQAESIVLGKCVSTRSAWDSQHHMILTYSTFQVEKALKGQPAQEVTVVTPGGAVGNIAQSNLGVPSFERGDENVIFVKNSRIGPTVLFFDQGAYNVSAANGDRLVEPVPTGAVLVDTQRGMAVAPESARPLRQFEREVRDSVDRTHAQKMEMMKGRRQQTSVVSLLGRYRLLIGLALLGALLATWQFVKRG
jgi:hypothetical protein